MVCKRIEFVVRKSTQDRILALLTIEPVSELGVYLYHAANEEFLLLRSMSFPVIRFHNRYQKTRIFSP